MTHSFSRPIVGAATALTLFACSPPAAAEAARTGFDQALLTQELSRHPDDPSLNFLSGLAYENSATSSTEARELARVGYRMALRQDSGFWRASYQLGLMALEERNPFAAQRYLLAAAQTAPHERRVFSALARASYCAGDIATALAALARAGTLGQTASADEVLTAALLAADTNDKPAVDNLSAKLPSSQRDEVASRLAAPRARQEAPKPPTAAGAKPAPSQQRMAVVDVVIIRRSEKSSQSSGINLLDALTLQFGSSLINSSWARSDNRIDPTQSTSIASSNSGVQLTIPTVTWSLNLANASGAASRIEARPTLLVHDGEEAKVFNGGSLTYATAGQLSSTSYTRDVGLSLSVKPKFTDEEHVTLGVSVVLENFVPAAPNGTFKEAVQTEKSATTVAADMRFGETLLVSSGASTTTNNNQSQTPVAGQIPILGKLFSSRVSAVQENTLLVLLTLRPVPGAAAALESADDSRQISALAHGVLGDFAEAVRLVPETRFSPYQLDNPAHVGVAEYLDPIVAQLHDRNLAMPLHR